MTQHRREDQANIFSIEKRRIVVLGAAGGIGRGIVEGLVTHGADVFVADQDADRLAALSKELNIGAKERRNLACDITDEDSVGRLFEIVGNEMGGLDGCVNTVGMNRYGELSDVSAKLWRESIEVNLTGAFMVSAAAARMMMQGSGGTILNFCSISSLSGTPTLGPYAAAKAGLANLTKTMALEWGPQIRVNAISPAMTETPMNTAWLHAEPGRMEAITKRFAVRRLGEPRDFVGPTIFLSSDASRFVTGQTICIDGGASARHPLVSDA